MNNLYFLTITVNGWIPVFHDFPETKQIILDSFNYITHEEIATIHAFVIMKDHIHFVCKINEPYKIKAIIKRFKSFTGKTIIAFLKDTDLNYVLTHFTSIRHDRKNKFWKLKSACLLLKHSDIVKQKLEYTHLNPTKGKYKEVENPNKYFYSSSKSYATGILEFPFLTLYK